jgi:hypothetical protein
MNPICILLGMLWKLNLLLPSGEINGNTLPGILGDGQDVAVEQY